MTISTETLDKFWKTHLEAAQEYVQIALESSAQFFGTQTKYLADISQLSRDKRLDILSDHPSRALEHWIQYLESHLDFIAEATHSHLESTSQFQFAVSRIAKDQIS